MNKETPLPAAPSSALAVVGGADQSGLRVYNERLILSLVRRFGRLSKVEVARLTGLSVQSTTAIMNRLLEEGLLRREAPLRGKVGQPTIPMSLEPQGAFSIGLKIGRRSCDLVLVDFCGDVRRREAVTFPYPTPEAVIAFVAARLPPLLDCLTAAESAKVAGLGIATPFELWKWAEEIGAPPGAMDGWRNFDVAAEVAGLCHCPVTLFNDAASACAAEFYFGEAWRRRDFLYFFVGTFVGGGVVLNGALYPGRTGNAAAVGSMPVARDSSPAGRGGARVEQLIACASILQLERAIEATGRDPSSIWRTPSQWDDFGAPLDSWISRAADALAQASLAALSIIDFEAIVIDGAMPAEVRTRLCRSVIEKFQTMDRRGLSDTEFVEGAIGADARAVGGAALPLIKSFARDREVLFKDAPIGPS
jgi:predicted NBD/HSP70 family sugar kinase